MSTFTYIILIIILSIGYAQIMFQLKKGDNLDIYEIDFTSNKELNESASLKQPFIFHFSHLDSILKKQLANIQDSYSGFEIYLKETNTYLSTYTPTSASAFLPIRTVATTLQTDQEHRYFTSGNQQFIQETGLIKSFQHLDHLFKPPLSIYTNYDIITGSDKATTPLLYHTFERRFLYIISGSIEIKLTPWRSTKYAIMYKNNYTREYGSSLNVWNPQPEFQAGYDKMRIQTCRIHEGSIIYIPPYWLYSIKFSYPTQNTNLPIIASFDYASPMNLITNIHNFANHYYSVFSESNKTIKEEIQKQQTQQQEEQNQNQNQQQEEQNQQQEEQDQPKKLTEFEITI